MTVTTSKKLKSFATTLALGGVLVVTVGLIYLFFTPKTYQASVKIRMRNWSRTDSTNDLHSTYGIATECQVACSDAILEQTIKNLGLNEIWGKRFNQGAALKPGQSLILLKAKAVARPIPKSSLFQIDVSSNDRDETARIANEIARLYHDKRQAELQALNSDKLAVFQQKWEEENQKVQTAQAALDKLYLDITRDRTTNPATMYDLIQARKADMESQYVEERDQLARLKAMSPEQLKEVLPTLETNTDSPLTTSLTQWSKARTDLVVAQSTYAADSQELKHASLVVDELDKAITRMIAGIMTVRENEVASSKAALDDLNEKLNRASVNLKEISIQNSTYAQARQDLENLKLKRDAIQNKMHQEDSLDLFMPAVAVPEIIDSAGPPQKPAIPNSTVAASTIGAGICAMLAGLFLLLVGQMPKTTPGKN